MTARARLCSEASVSSVGESRAAISDQGSESFNGSNADCERTTVDFFAAFVARDLVARLAALRGFTLAALALLFLVSDFENVFFKESRSPFLELAGSSSSLLESLLEAPLGEATNAALAVVDAAAAALATADSPEPIAGSSAASSAAPLGAAG